MQRSEQVCEVSLIKYCTSSLNRATIAIWAEKMLWRRSLGTCLKGILKQILSASDSIPAQSVLLPLGLRSRGSAIDMTFAHIPVSTIRRQNNG